MATDEILVVKTYHRESNSNDIYVKCPHCDRLLELEAGDFKGEMFTDKVCGGTLEVSHNAYRTAFPQED
ncbi:hypothetical protein [Burkholderia territorii]|uniref:hypothetical protein n=1 Tax=Burkholderia territorii TaxID=1503055 RepID=UPI00075AF0F5|nr:hypothetical protein [Burkholderia territorii]KWE37432.1 hypothetical protein WT49_11395 [Burkholderia territorii]KWE38472.1 hypothetical protein WT50_20250 [Burkholderia territorii]KWE40351.1 hypothetical protein WT51_28145 [Burkholderia territorii]